MTLSSRNLVLLCAFLYLLMVAVLCGGIWHKTGGHFVYALDDPYIHLALAENLAHGHYGINAGEYSSPSSSVLWPFLLIPFAGTAVHTYVPLMWNVLLGCLAACLIGWVVAQVQPAWSDTGRLAWWQQAAIAILLILAGNLASLTIVGMEHVLQVLFAICCAIGMMEALEEREIPLWCLAAGAIGPMVRYEDLSLTMALCIALAGQRRWAKFWGMWAVSLTPLIAFSAFLKSKGLPELPLSVLVKAGFYTEGYTSTSPVLRALRLIATNFFSGFIKPVRMPMMVFFLLFAALAWRERSRVRRFALGGIAVAALLQLTVGVFGWFHRYEVYAMIFMALVCVRVLPEMPRFRFVYLAAGLIVCAIPYAASTTRTIAASTNVYLQQYQMHRFVSEHYLGNFAVNDIGLTSLQRPTGSYVLDLWGLASEEAQQQKDKSAVWMTRITNEHHADLAMIYPRWFHVPPAWTPMAKMCNPTWPAVLAQQCMVFYSTNPSSDKAIRADLEMFADTLPAEVVFQFNPSQSDAETPVPLHKDGKLASSSKISH